MDFDAIRNEIVGVSNERRKEMGGKMDSEECSFESSWKTRMKVKL